jgi:hypothetical protein
MALQIQGLEKAVTYLQKRSSVRCGQATVQHNDDLQPVSHHEWLSIRFRYRAHWTRPFEQSWLADIGAEFLFQMISERAERAAIIVTTNLSEAPYSGKAEAMPSSRRT